MNITSLPGARAATASALLLAFGLQAANSAASPASSPREEFEHAASGVALERAQRFFYNGYYDQAAAEALRLCQGRPDDFSACELRTAALLFQIKKALKETGALDKATAWGRCAGCPALMSAFVAETVASQTVARAKLTVNPDDEDTLFFLGKVDLNYVWLQLGTLGRKTGWDEYWEARRSLDHALRMNPRHVRSRVARAWVDYIVGTTIPRGVRWLLGGGNKKRGLLVVRDVVAHGSGDFFIQAEATFALWDMQMRERQVAEAIATARTLLRDFPENAELRTFLSNHDATARITGSGHVAP